MRRALAFLILLLAPISASAQSSRLALVELWSPPNLAGIAAKLSQDIANEIARQPATELVPAESVRSTLGTEAYQKLQACAGKVVCVMAHTGNLKADRLLVGMLDRSETSYLVKIYLVDLKAGAIVSTIDRAVLIASRRLQGDVLAALPNLLRGQAEATGKLSVATSSPGATVLVDEVEAGHTPLTVQAKPGKHTLRVLKDGYMALERFVNVEASVETQVSLMMTPIPGAVVEDEPVARKQADSEGAGGLAVPVASWVAGGGAVAAAAVGVVFAARVSSVAGRAGSGEPAYNITRQEALTAKRDAAIAHVAFSVAGAGAAAAVLFAIFTPPEPKPAAAPAAPPPQAALVPLEGGAALSIAGAF